MDLADDTSFVLNSEIIKLQAYIFFRFPVDSDCVIVAVETNQLMFGSNLLKGVKKKNLDIYVICVLAVLHSMCKQGCFKKKCPKLLIMYKN